MMKINERIILAWYDRTGRIISFILKSRGSYQVPNSFQSLSFKKLITHLDGYFLTISQVVLDANNFPLYVTYSSIHDAAVYLAAFEFFKRWCFYF